MKITERPALLFIKLIRYVFDRTTFEKRKLKTEVTFPAKLRLEDEDYELAAVLYHKGVSAYGGHYVTEVLDMDARASGGLSQRDTWWLCDDEVVLPSVNPGTLGGSSSSSSSSTSNKCQKTNNGSASDDAIVIDDDRDAQELGPGTMPSSARPSRSAAKSGNKNSSSSGGRKGGRALKAEAIDEQEEEEDDDGDDVVVAVGKKRSRSKGGGGASAVDGQARGVNRNKDAYMLSYVKTSELEKCVTRGDRAGLPSYVEDAVKQSSEEFQREIHAYDDQRRRYEAEIEERKKLLDAFESACSSSALGGDDVHFVPSGWLQRWATGERPESSKSAVQPPDGPTDAATVIDMTNDDEKEATALDATEASSDGTKNVIESAASSGLAATATSFYPTLFADPFDNDLRPLLCHHGVSDVDPQKLAFCKAVPDAAYRILQNSVASGINAQRVCGQCSDASDGRLSSAESKLHVYENILGMIDKQPNDGLAFRVAKEFVIALRNKIKGLTRAIKSKDQGALDLAGESSSSTSSSGGLDAVEKSDEHGTGKSTWVPPVNQSILCRHGRIGCHPDKLAKVVTAQSWKAIKAEFSPGAIELDLHVTGNVANVEGCQRGTAGAAPKCGCCVPSNKASYDPWFCCACE